MRILTFPESQVRAAARTLQATFPHFNLEDVLSKYPTLAVRHSILQHKATMLSHVLRLQPSVQQKFAESMKSPSTAGRILSASIGCVSVETVDMQFAAELWRGSAVGHNAWQRWNPRKMYHMLLWMCRVLQRIEYVANVDPYQERRGVAHLVVNSKSFHAAYPGFEKWQERLLQEAALKARVSNDAQPSGS